MANKNIRSYAKAKGVFLWEVAALIGISEPTMTRKLRYDLPKDEEEKIIEVIDTIAAEKAINSYTTTKDE